MSMGDTVDLGVPFSPNEIEHSCLLLSLELLGYQIRQASVPGQATGP